MALYHELTGGVVQFLADVLADALELAAAVALGAVGLVIDKGAGQCRRQELAARLLLGLGADRRRRRWFRQLRLDGGNVTIDQLIKQARLVRAHTLAVATETVALEDRQLLSQLVVEDGLVVDNLILLLKLLALVLALLLKAGDHAPKLLR